MRPANQRPNANGQIPSVNASAWVDPSARIVGDVSVGLYCLLCGVEVPSCIEVPASAAVFTRQDLRLCPVRQPGWNQPG